MQSKALHKLLAMQSNVTILDILRKTNSENVHSSMLTWILSTPEFQSVPIPPALLMLQLVISKGLDKNIISIDSDHLKSIFVTPLSLDIEALTERAFNNRKRIDICVEITINDSKHFRLWIENKLFSRPGYKQLETYSDSIDSIDPDHKFINIKTYLSPSIDNAPDHSAFIHITYQELYDRVLIPLRDQLKACTHNKYIGYLDEYIDSLHSFDNSFNPIVKSMEYSECLKEIYDNYSDIFIAAISNYGTEEEKTAVAKISRSYEIEFNNKHEIISGYTSLARRVFEILLSSGVDRDELLKKLGEIDKTQIPGFDSEVAATKENMGAPSRYSTRTIGRPKIYISNQWSSNKADCFIRLVKQYYPNLKIHKK